MVRARHILTSLAVVGIGGAIRSLVRDRAARRPTRPVRRVDSHRDAAVPTEIDGIDTSPINALEEEVIYLEAQLPPDNSVLDLSILEPPVEPESMTAVDARPDDMERVVAELFDAADVESEPGDQGDDRANGENWVEDLLVDSTLDVPVEQPLYLSDEDASPRRRHH
jgi:hypothetical protein